MKIVKIPKRKGEFRTIYVPSYPEKRALKKLMPALNKAMLKCTHAHGFKPGTSAVTNAIQHVGYRYSLCFDLKDFFDTVTPAHVAGKLPKEIIEKVFVDGHPRQGLPTSPAVANLAAYDLDLRIVRLKKRFNIDFVYTRYADDLSFSFQDIHTVDVLLREVPVLVEKFGFVINTRKTEFQDATKRRRHITGVGVDDQTIHPTRAAKRKLRAALHQQNTNQANGLAEWCKLKLPKPRKPRRMSEGELQKAAHNCYVALTLSPNNYDVFQAKAFKGNTRILKRATYKIFKKVEKRIKKRSKSPQQVSTDR